MKKVSKPKLPKPITKKHYLEQDPIAEMQEMFSNMVNEIVKTKSVISNLKIEISEIKSQISNLQNQISKTNSVKSNPEKPKPKPYSYEQTKPFNRGKLAHLF